MSTAPTFSTADSMVSSAPVDHASDESPIDDVVTSASASSIIPFDSAPPWPGFVPTRQIPKFHNAGAISAP